MTQTKTPRGGQNLAGLIERSSDEDETFCELHTALFSDRKARICLAVFRPRAGVDQVAGERFGAQALAGK